MKHSKKLALMFMTSFIGSVLVLVLFVLYALNGSVLDRALVKSDYVALVHQEVLVAASQSVSAYGLRSDVMDVVFTEERVHDSVMANLKGLEAMDLKTAVMDELHAEIDRMNLTFTQDVEKGMLELSDKLMGNFKQRSRFPLQGTIMGLLQRIMPYLYGISLVLFVLFIVFVRRLKTLASREQNTVYQSIIGTWIVMLGFWSLISMRTLVIEPVSFKTLIVSVHSIVQMEGTILFLFLSLTFMINTSIPHKIDVGH